MLEICSCALSRSTNRRRIRTCLPASLVDRRPETQSGTSAAAITTASLPGLTRQSRATCSEFVALDARLKACPRATTRGAGHDESLWNDSGLGPVDHHNARENI